MDVLLISVTELRMFSKYLAHCWRWTNLIFDEAHKMKNEESKTFEALCQINVDFKLMITATPLTSTIKDLWNIIYYINQDYVGDTLKVYKFPVQDPDAVTVLNLVCI